MSTDRLLPPSTLIAGILVGLATATALLAWGPEWHGGIILLLIAAGVVAGTVLASRLAGGQESRGNT